MMYSVHGGGSQTPERVIIHSMGEFIKDGEKLYFAKDWLDKLGLSAHYLITPSGVIVQTRRDNQMAYHAKGNNINTIGIEILVPGAHTYDTFAERIKTPYIYGEQYTSLVTLSRKFNLPFYRHSDIDPERKVDPGNGLDWQTFLHDIS